MGRLALCPKCGHRWTYTGQAKYYLTCPCCYRKIPVSKALIGGEKIGNEE